MAIRPIVSESKGFTLLELLIAITIIGILAGIAIPLFLGQRTKAMRTEGETNLRIMSTANENNYAEYGRYAPSTDGTKEYKGDRSSGSLDEELRALKFGKVADLNFTYTLQSCPVNTSPGQAFLAKATGKAGTPLEGIVLTLNQLNELGDGTATCGP